MRILNIMSSKVKSENYGAVRSVAPVFKVFIMQH